LEQMATMLEAFLVIYHQMCWIQFAPVSKNNWWNLNLLLYVVVFVDHFYFRMFTSFV
jgi:hypothetical protein